MAVAFVVLGSVGYGIGRWRRDYLDSIPVPHREVSSSDLDPQGVVTEKVFFDVSVNNNTPKRIIFGLYGHDYPVLVKNFGDLCDGIAYYNKETKQSYDYSNTTLHRIIPGVLCQGGVEISSTPTTEAAHQLMTDYATEKATHTPATPPTTTADAPATTQTTPTTTTGNFVTDKNGVKTLAPSVSIANIPDIVGDIMTTARSVNGAAAGKYKHCKFGVLSTSASEEALGSDRGVVGTDYVITFNDAPLLDRLTSSNTYTVIGQVMYNGGEILQEIESFGSTTGTPREYKAVSTDGTEVLQPTIVKIMQCGRLPAMSKAIEPQQDEIIDNNGKNINQMIN